MEFTLSRLTDYSDKDIIRKIQRVAKVLNISPLTITSFHRESKVHVSTINRRFSSWKKALEAAGLGHLYGGQIVTKNMREQKNRNISDEELLNELRRVTKLIDATYLFRKEFKKCSEISPDTIQKRFGGWRSALERAGLVNRWSGGTGQSRKYTNEGMTAELHKISATLRGQPVTREVFDRYSQMNSATVLNRFGSWAKALKHAGLEISNLGKRYTQDEYWENLLLVWTRYGCQPTYGEMRHAPSTIGAEAYHAKWGTWRKALLAFIEYANSDSKLYTSADLEESPTPIEKIDVLSQEPLSLSKRESPENRREIPLSLRFKIMYRDHFKCVLCGSNPPANPGLILHIDHIKPSAILNESIQYLQGHKAKSKPYASRFPRRFLNAEMQIFRRRWDRAVFRVTCSGGAITRRGQHMRTTPDRFLRPRRRYRRVRAPRQRGPEN